MHIIQHRINEVALLRKLPSRMGAEIDIRSHGTNLILGHDPFVSGEKLEDYLTEWIKVPRGILALNLKEDGIEKAVLEEMRKHSLLEYFMMDLPLPSAVRAIQKENIREIALRVSEYESPENALKFSGKADWIWLDCFTGEPPSDGTLKKLLGRFKICLVSPELHGFPKDRIPAFFRLIPYINAVCTKFPEAWSSQ